MPDALGTVVHILIAVIAGGAYVHGTGMIESDSESLDISIELPAADGGE